MTAGQTAQYTATATYSDGTSENVTSNTAWSTNNSGLATISSSGVLTAVAAGDVKVRADFGGQTAYTYVTVVPGSAPSATLTWFAASGPGTVSVGGTAQMTATGTYSDGTSRNVTSRYCVVHQQ